MYSITSLINYYYTICTTKLPPYRLAYFGDLSQFSASILAIPEATRSWQPLKNGWARPKGLAHPFSEVASCL